MSEICRFYNSLNIFITGGTGFLGKILIEKLLRSTDVATIYILIREKKGKSSNQRLNEMLDDVLFERLKQEKPKYHEHIIVINGDCSLSGLGLNMIDKNRLIDEVNIVFHMAATVRFNENIKLAHTINVQGTQTILEISKQMKHLKAIIHISTAYSHCHLTEIDEKIYDVAIDSDKLRHLLERFTPQEAEKITLKLIGNYPNTYTFTKGLAEDVIYKCSGNLPVAIFRPSIVTSTYREPISGWVDNYNGPMGLSVGMISGLTHILECDQYKTSNIVPVDMCVNALIAIGWNTANHTKLSHKKCPIYNYVTTPENPIQWGEILFLLNQYMLLNPYKDLIWSPHAIAIKNHYFYKFIYFFLHFLPALFYDFIGSICGFKSHILLTTQKLEKMNGALKFFTTNDWKFHNENTKKLWKKLNEEDQQIFPFNMNELSWLTYFHEYVKGIRIYLLNDPLETLSMAKSKLKRLKIISIIIVYLMYCLSFWLLGCLINNLF